MDPKALRQNLEHELAEHRAALRTVAEAAPSDAAGGGAGDDRRQFLRRVGVSGAAVAVGALAAVPVASFATSVWAQTTTKTLEGTDAAVAQLAASLELSLVELYTNAVDTGKLDPALAEAANVFRGHHQDHATKLNSELGKNDVVVVANQPLLNEFQSRIKGAADQSALLNLLYQLEESMAATYQLALTILDSTTGAATAASILPVEGQQAVVWGQALEKAIAAYVPAFQTDTAAFRPERYAG